MLDNITHLICYDTDTVLNLKRLPSRKHICLFISNTYDTLFASINDRKNKGDFDHIYVCSDPKRIIPNKIEQLKIDDLNKCVFAITGIFSTSDNNLVPLKNIPEFMRFDFCFPPKGRTINDYKIYGFEL